MKHDGMAKTDMMTKTEMMVTPHPFIKAKYKISGDVTILEKDGMTILRLSEDFKTKNGPDLKLFLSPQMAGEATGQTATQGAVKLDVLRSNKGAQDYILPEGVSLADFNSLLIHCEQYSVLWGGANLR